MKFCKNCGAGFVGFGSKCDVCRKSPAKKSVVISADVTSMSGMSTATAKKIPHVAGPSSVKAGVVDVCPTCKRPMRAMTGAERQRKYRSKRPRYTRSHPLSAFTETYRAGTDRPGQPRMSAFRRVTSACPPGADTPGPVSDFR